MAKKKDASDDSITVTIQGKSVVIPRGDLSDEAWAAVKERFMAPSSAEDQKALEERQAKESTVDVKAGDPTYYSNTGDRSAYEKDRTVDVKAGDPTYFSNTGDRSAYASDAKVAEKKPQAQGSDKQDFMELRGPDGKKFRVVRGELDDNTWKQHVDQARASGRLVTSVETVPDAEQAKQAEAADAPKGRGQSLFGSGITAMDLFGGALDKKDEKARAAAAYGSKEGAKMAAAADLNAPDAPTADEKKASAGAEYGRKMGAKMAAAADLNAPDAPSPTAAAAAAAGRRPDVPLVQLNKQETDPELLRLQQEKTDLMNVADVPSAPPPNPSANSQAEYDAWKAGGGMNSPNTGPTAGPGHYDPVAAANTTVTPPAAVVPPMAAKGPSTPVDTAPKMPEMPDRTGEINDAYAQADLARQKNADVQSQGLKDQQNLMHQQQLNLVSQQADQLRAQETIQKTISDGQAAVMKTMQDMSAPAKTDPDRWWNSRSTAQKIFAVLSAGLTRGASVDAFQHAISEDVAMQQQDIDNKRNFQHDKLGAQMNVLQMAQSNKLDLYESQKVARAFAWEQIEMSAKQTALNTQSELVKTNATEMSAMANIQKQKELAGVDQHRQLMGLEGVKLQMEDRHNKAMEGAAWAHARAAQAKAAKSGLQPVRGVMAQNLSDMQTALNQAKGYSAEFKKVAGSFLGRLINHVTQYIPGTGASEYEAKRELAIQLIGKGLEGGVLRPDDIIRYEKMIPKSTDNNGAVRWDEMIKQLQNRLSTHVKGAQQMKFDTGSFTGGSQDASDEDVSAALGFEADQ